MAQYQASPSGPPITLYVKFHVKYLVALINMTVLFPNQCCIKVRIFWKLIYESSYCNFPESRKKLISKIIFFTLSAADSKCYLFC